MNKKRKPKDSELVDFENWYFVHETEKAILVKEASDSKIRFWLPKEAAEYEVKRGGKIDFTIPRRLAEEKEMPV